MSKLEMPSDVLISNFKKLLELVRDSHLQHEILLPVCHIPNEGKIGKIVESGELKPCTNNTNYENEELLFFYYGRSIYLSREQKELNVNTYFPFLFVYNLDNIRIPIARLLPFDSGGYSQYEFSKIVSLSDFEIKGPKSEEIKKLIIILYENYKDYLEYKPKFESLANKLKPFLPALNELFLFYNKIVATPRRIVDGRAMTFELQFAHSIPLNHDFVLCPDVYMADEDTKKQFDIVFTKDKIRPYITNDNPVLNGMNIELAFKNIINTNYGLQ